MSHEKRKALGRYLLDQQAARAEDVERVAAQANPSGTPIATRLFEAGVVSEIDALKALSAQRGVPALDLNQICLRLADLATLPRDIALVHKLLPVLERIDRVFIAMANPEDSKVIEEIEFVTGKRVFAYVALEGTLLRTIREAYDARDRGESHFVGRACPPDALRRAGLDPRNYPHLQPDTSSKRPASTPTSANAPAQPKVQTHPYGEGFMYGQRAGIEVRTTLESEIASPFADLPYRWNSADGAPADPRARPRSSGSQIRPSTSTEARSRALDAELVEADAEEPSAARVEPAPRGRGTAPGASPKRILVVDDEREIRLLIRRVLEESGHVVLEADRGQLAIEMLASEQPDLLVLDAMLPEVHGFDIARHVRDAYPLLPIVMVSAVYRGWRFAEDAKQAYGVDAYLEKPFRVQELLKVVESALRTAKQPGQREPSEPERIQPEAQQLLQQGLEAYRSGELERASDLLRRGVTLDPFAYRLRFHLGLLLGKRGLLYEAIEQLERAVQLESHHFASLKNLAILYQQAGFQNKALEAWERALKATADEDTRRAIKEHIVSLL